MPTDCISYQNSGYFSKLIVDYLDQNISLKPLYHHYPTLTNFEIQMKEKGENFTKSNRMVLVNALMKQYENFEVSPETLTHIDGLQDQNTYTITTGHQLNLFTGPVFFMYKIASTINLCKQLKTKYPNQNFVPVYWMATEDHDFDEINFFKINNQKIAWNKKSTGPVGRLNTDGLQEVLEQLKTALGKGEDAHFLIDLFEKAYVKHHNLAAATRFLVNELFKNEGLVIVDGDNADLKKLFIPYVENELVNQQSFGLVNQTNLQLKHYNIQVNPREINLFYIEDDLRERIVFENNLYKINNTDISFTETEILELLQKSPEKFSPNVILRPLYQEVILPNLAYIGGGGELAYWLQLKSNFEVNKVTFPMLILRNSAVVITEKQNKKREKLNLTWEELFLKEPDLIRKKTTEFSEINFDFTQQKTFLKQQFETLQQIALKTDKSFGGAVLAQQAKQIKGLENLEKKLLKAEKRIHAEKLNLITKLQNELFPNGILQERSSNFAPFYLEFGIDFFNKLQQLDPLSNEFCIIN